MSENSIPDEAARPSRPAAIDRALYALAARALLAIIAALALFGARSEVSDGLAKATNPKLTAGELPGHVSSYLRENLITTVAFSLMVLIIAKFIRDGRNWARWLYLEFAFLIPGDVLQVIRAFAYNSLPLRLLSALTGLSAIAALVFLFLPASANYLRRPGSRPALAGLFQPRPRGQLRGGPPAAESLPAETLPASELAQTPTSPADAPARRQVRAKSRRAPTE